jgi:hypothetical protein
MNYENLIRTIVAGHCDKIIEAFVGPKQLAEFRDEIKKNPDPEKIYSHFVINKSSPYADIIDLINKNVEQLPNGFKEKFVEYHKKFKKNEEQISKKYQDTNEKNYKHVLKDVPQKNAPKVVAKIDNFTIVNTYKGMSSEGKFDTFKEVLKLIQDAVNVLKAKGFSSVIYGEILLKNPDSADAIATYNNYSDEIRLKFFKDRPDHALESVVHEIAHRIWFKLMNDEDRNLWGEEYIRKMKGKYVGDYPGFPRDYSKKNVKEYFATLIEEYLAGGGKKYSELLDLIV